MKGKTFAKSIIFLLSCSLLPLCTLIIGAAAETIRIETYEEFENWWSINEGTFQTDGPPPAVPNPSMGGVWFIAGETVGPTSFCATFDIGEKTCYSTQTSIIIQYYSYNSVVTLFPSGISGDPDPYYHFPISSGPYWSSTGSFPISDDNDGQIITITGEILPSGFFAFDLMHIILDGTTTGCTTSVPESTTQEMEESTIDSSTCETPEEDFTITVTTERVTVQTTEEDETTTELDNTDTPSTTEVPEPDSTTFISSSQPDYTTEWTTPEFTTMQPPTPTPSVTGEPPIFSCINRPDGMYPHPTDCAKYIHCLSQVPREHTCPEPLLFDPVIRACNFPHLVDCSQFSCVNKPDGMYPHPMDCAKYIHCLAEVLREYTCPEPLLFDPITQACNFPHLVNCGLEMKAGF